jgi:hypothetical protein
MPNSSRSQGVSLGALLRDRLRKELMFQQQ